MSLANFIDTMIDYPMAKEYSFEMFDKLGELKIITSEQIETYKKHIHNLEVFEDEAGDADEVVEEQQNEEEEEEEEVAPPKTENNAVVEGK